MCFLTYDVRQLILRFMIYAILKPARMCHLRTAKLQNNTPTQHNDK